MNWKDTVKDEVISKPTPPSLARLDFSDNAAMQWLSKYRALPIILSAVYIVVIFGIKRLMWNRARYELRQPLIVWNAMLAIFSIVTAARAMPESIYGAYQHGWEYSLCVPVDYQFLISTSNWSTLFVASKVLEFGDTVFIVLRKQPLIFLHWYHHVTVLIYCWYSFADACSPCRWFASVNLLVHSFMYTYYYTKARRIRLPRWVSVFLTSLQISQMVFGIYVNMSAKWVLDRGDECHVTYENVIYSLLVYASYFLLFGFFFYNSYMKPKKGALSAIGVVNEPKKTI